MGKLLPSFEIPRELQLDQSSKKIFQQQLSAEEDYLKFIRRGRGIMGMPSHLASPKNYVEFLSAQNFSEQIYTICKMSGINTKENSSEIQQIVQSSESAFLICLNKSFNTIPPDILAEIISECDLYIEKNIAETILKKITKLYFSIKNASKRLIHSDVFLPALKNGSILSPSREEPGLGSYNRHGLWQFGQQDLPSMSLPYAEISSSITHPAHEIRFSLVKNKNVDGYMLLVQNIKYWINHYGFLLRTEAEKLQKEIKILISHHIKNISNWKISGSSQDAEQTALCTIKLLGQEKKHFRITAFIYSGTGKLMLFSHLGHKYYEKTFVSNNFPQELFEETENMVSEYVSSELAAYAFCAINNARVSHPAQVCPNGNAWSAFRLLGGITSSVAASYGQGALNVNSNYSFSLPVSGFYPLKDAKDEEEDHPNYSSIKHIHWDNFLSQVHVNKQKNAVIVTHASSEYSVSVLKTKNIYEKEILCQTADKEVFERFIIYTNTPTNVEIIGAIALAAIIGVSNYPNYESLNMVVLESNKTPLHIFPKNSINSSKNLFSENEHFFSYNINHSSFTLRKYSASDNVNGLLTPIFAMKYQNRSTDFFSKGRSRSYADLAKICLSPEIELPNSSNQNDENPIFRYFNPEAISRKMSELAQEEIPIPSLPKVFPDYRNADSEKGIYCPLSVIGDQKFGLSYVVKLTGEYIPEEPEPLIENPGQPKNAMKKSFDEEAFRKDTLGHFEKFYTFEILCIDKDGAVIIDYTPTHNTPGGYIPRLSLLENIITVYLPDFISWVNIHGIYLFNNYRSQTGKDASSESIRFFTPEGSPFPLDQTMSMEYAHSIKQWISKKYPSIMDEIPFGKKASTVFSHLMRSVTLVDYKRSDGYMPSELIKETRKSELFRLTMFLHDIGKVSTIDGGVGPFVENHENVSVQIASSILDYFTINEHERIQVLKWILNHHLFEKAVDGEFGGIDDATQHVATIIGKEDDADIYYHMFRCDVDPFPDFGVGENQKSTSVSSHLNTTPLDFLHEVKKRIAHSIFTEISWKDVVPNRQKSTRITTNSEISSNVLLSESGEFVQKTHRFSTYSNTWGDKKVFEEFNPGYFEKMQLLKNDVIKNPDKSFAKEFGMAYDGPTGSILRCFFWTRPHFLGNIFSNGLRSYAGKDSRSFFALINGPMLSNYANNGTFSSKKHSLTYDEAKSLIVFDYHAGNVIFEDEAEETITAVRKWKLQKMGPQLFSLSCDPDDVSDGSKFLMEIGYTGIIKAGKDEAANQIVGISCFDPSRVALITAYTLPRGIYEGMFNDATNLVHHRYKAYPSNILVRTSHGFDKIITLPEIENKEIFLSQSHDFFAKIAVAPDKIHVQQEGSKIWRGIPSVNSSGA